MVPTTARRTQAPSDRLYTSHTLVALVVSALDPDDEVTVTDTVFAAFAPVTAFDATLLLLDSAPVVLTLCTVKYQVAGVSELMVVRSEVGSSTTFDLVKELLLVPYNTL